MPSYWSNDTGLIYVSSNYNMKTGTHGGHEDEHKEEIERITNEIIDKKIDELMSAIEQNIYLKSVDDFLDALKVDINSVVQVGFSNAADIFYGEKCQESIKSAIYNEIIKNLNKR